VWRIDTSYTREELIKFWKWSGTYSVTDTIILPLRYQYGRIWDAKKIFSEAAVFVCQLYNCTMTLPVSLWYGGGILSAECCQFQCCKFGLFFWTCLEICSNRFVKTGICRYALTCYITVLYLNICCTHMLHCAYLGCKIFGFNNCIIVCFHALLYFAEHR